MNSRQFVKEYPALTVIVCMPTLRIIAGMILTPLVVFAATSTEVRLCRSNASVRQDVAYAEADEHYADASKAAHARVAADYRAMLSVNSLDERKVLQTQLKVRFKTSMSTARETRKAEKKVAKDAEKRERAACDAAG